MKHHLDPQQSALIIIDMQNDFCHAEGASAQRGLANAAIFQSIVPQIGALIETPEMHQGTIANISNVFGLTLSAQEILTYWGASKGNKELAG